MSDQRSISMVRRHGRRFFDLGADFYAWITWQRTWRAHCASLVDFFPRRPQLDVLDLGVGPGVSAISIVDRLPDARVVGLDLAGRMLLKAKGYLARTGTAQQIALIHADATTLPFQSSSFDVVTGHSFLYLVPDRQTVVREIARVLRPGGRCVFVEPATSGKPWTWACLEGPLRFRLSMGLWRVVSRRAGRFDAATLRELLSPLGDCEITPTLGGLGYIVVASAKEV